MFFLCIPVRWCNPNCHFIASVEKKSFVCVQVMWQKQIYHYVTTGRPCPFSEGTSPHVSFLPLLRVQVSGRQLQGIANQIPICTHQRSVLKSLDLHIIAVLSAVTVGLLLHQSLSRETFVEFMHLTNLLTCDFPQRQTPPPLPSQPRHPNLLVNKPYQVCPLPKSVHGSNRSCPVFLTYIYSYVMLKCDSSSDIQTWPGVFLTHHVLLLSDYIQLSSSTRVKASRGR